MMTPLYRAQPQYKDMPTMGFTHFQPAQLVTVGKRAALWLQDLWLDFQKLEDLIESLPMRGVKGTTGTQASFLDLFEGDHAKVKKLNELVAEQMGFKKVIPLSGQTYSRKIDYFVLSVLSGIAQSAYKMAGASAVSLALCYSRWMHHGLTMTLSMASLCVDAVDEQATSVSSRT